MVPGTKAAAVAAVEARVMMSNTTATSITGRIFMTHARESETARNLRRNSGIKTKDSKLRTLVKP